MAKVWVVNLNAHDISDAERYGEVTVLTKDRVNIFQIDNVILDITRKLETAEKGDYVLLSGYGILNMIVGHFFLKKFGVLNALQWNALTSMRRYSVLTISDSLFKL